ncbi:TPA: hypothetical protein N0F65_008261 [Lagenidium giganteum]|uniref:Uncharacterized protein n=1 Tax=Lagenidium giganteum TaxID=4803 RepID=A0AAV2YNC4_9STRA|nr:TPA: hypothetical protein N0F65_008261 [Lagenidium giganteum]
MDAFPVRNPAVVGQDVM